MASGDRSLCFCAAASDADHSVGIDVRHFKAPNYLAGLKLKVQSNLIFHKAGEYSYLSSKFKLLL